MYTCTSIHSPVSELDRQENAQLRSFSTKYSPSSIIVYEYDTWYNTNIAEAMVK